jgi:two-component system OmpR family sensor kinase
MRIPVRLRLTLGFAMSIAVLLTAVGALAYDRLADGISSDLDRELRQRAQDLSALVTSPSGGSLDRVDTHGFVEEGESFAEVVDADGRVLVATPTLRRTSLLTPPQLTRALQKPVTLDVPTAPGLDEPARLLATPLDVEGRPAAFVLGVTKGNGIEDLQRVEDQLWTGIPILVLLAALSGYVLLGVALKPIDDMRRRAASISALALEGRLPLPPGRDTFARLGATLNELLDRLEDGQRQQRTFVANASHELRTPLATMALELELAVRHPRSREDLEASIRSSQAEVARLSNLADSLLTLSTTDRRNLVTSPVPLDPLVENVVLRFSEAARAQGRSVRVDCHRGVVVQGDRDRLDSAVSNLVANALGHGAGDIDVTTDQIDGWVEVHVLDAGPGLDSSVRDTAFNALTRGRSTGGSGLGLAIVAAVATAHGGVAGVADRPLRGVDAWIRLPTGTPAHERRCELP